VIEIIEASFCPREKIIYYPNYCEKIIKKIMQYIKLLLVVLFAVLLGSIAARRTAKRRVLSRRTLGGPVSGSGSITLTSTQTTTASVPVTIKVTNPKTGTLCVQSNKAASEVGKVSITCSAATVNKHDIKVGTKGTVIQGPLSASTPSIVQANTDYCVSKHSDGSSLLNEAYQVTCLLDSYVHVTLTNS
jgi:hypothetical protein